MGDPKPLSPANVRKPFHFVKRKYAERQDANARERAEQAEQVLRNEQCAVLKACEASVLRLLDMERSRKSYHRTEWRRQIASCKHDTLRVLRQEGVRVSSGSVQHGPVLKNCEAGSIIMDWGLSKWNLRRLQLVVLWHPNPKLTYREFLDSYTEGAIEHVKVLSMPLTDADMEVAGWTYPEGWHPDEGHDGSEWFPINSSNARADR